MRAALKRSFGGRRRCRRRLRRSCRSLLSDALHWCFRTFRKLFAIFSAFFFCYSLSDVSPPRTQAVGQPSRQRQLRCSQRRRASARISRQRRIRRQRKRRIRTIRVVCSFVGLTPRCQRRKMQLANTRDSLLSILEARVRDVHAFTRRFVVVVRICLRSAVHK